MSGQRVIDAETAQRVPLPAPELAEADAGETTGGMVEVKARIPIHLHLALLASASKNNRSKAAEIRTAIRSHVEAEMRRG